MSVLTVFFDLALPVVVDERFVADESVVADEAVAADEDAGDWPAADSWPLDTELPKKANIISVPMNSTGVSRLVRARLCSERIASSWGIAARVYPMNNGLRLLSLCAYLNIQGRA